RRGSNSFSAPVARSPRSASAGRRLAPVRRRAANWLPGPCCPDRWRTTPSPCSWVNRRRPCLGRSDGGGDEVDVGKQDDKPKVITSADLYERLETQVEPRIKRLEVMVAVVIAGGIWDTI